MRVKLPWSGEVKRGQTIEWSAELRTVDGPCSGLYGFAGGITFDREGTYSVDLDGAGALRVVRVFENAT